ncbi:MAG: hypothetical protein ABWZ53_05755 [Actinomycetota bacterium]|jgi:DNA-binding Lrp family transcriptional regulator
MDTAFVFDPKGNYKAVQKIRDAGMMPVAGLRYVASVTGPYKIFQVVTVDTLDQLDDRLDSLPGGGGSDDPPTALVIGNAKVRKSTYLAHTALVRIDVRAADPAVLMDQIKDAIGPDSDGGVEADVVESDFDILACVVADDEDALRAKILNIREIEGVKRTVSLRVIDYVSTSENAPDDHRVEPAG